MIEGERLNCCHGNEEPAGEETEVKDEDEILDMPARLKREENDDRNCCRRSAIGWNRDLYLATNVKGSDEHYVEQKAPFCLVSYERGDNFVQSL